jgi:hypothetical protein
LNIDEMILKAILNMDGEFEAIAALVALDLCAKEEEIKPERKRHE